MRYGKWTAWLVGAMVLLSAAMTLAAEAPQPEPVEPADAPKPAASDTPFLRVVRDAGDVPTALEAAVVRHVPQDCGLQAPTVDLISAVHVAEKSYYEQINRRFRDYDVVLYELVAPEGARIEPGQAGGSPVSALQRGMKNVLKLTFQLDEVDYTAKNLVHADMSPEQFAESMRNRGESLWTMFFRMMGYAMARQGGSGGGSSDVAMLVALLNPNRSLALKRVMAEQFEDMEGSLMAMEGPEGSTMIAERNKVALTVLRKQIDAGHRKIAIFYGAGHMSHFQRELKEQFNLVPVQTDWLVAWDLKSEKPAQEDAEKKARDEAEKDAGAEADEAEEAAAQPTSASN